MKSLAKLQSLILRGKQIVTFKAVLQQRGTQLFSQKPSKENERPRSPRGVHLPGCQRERGNRCSSVGGGDGQLREAQKKVLRKKRYIWGKDGNDFKRESC